MRVIQVAGAFAPVRCGIAHYTVRLAEELAAAGIETAIASIVLEGDARVPLLPVQGRSWGMLALINLLRLAISWRADWLHVQFAPGSFDYQRTVGLLPVLSRLVPGAPRIAVTAHEYGGWELRLPGLLHGPGRLGLTLAERAGWLDRELITLLTASHLAIVTNPTHQRRIGRASARMAEVLHLVPIGPNVEPALARGLSSSDARQTLGVERDRLIIVFFGFIHPVKGIETLLEAAAIVRQALPHLRVWLIGGVHSLALRGREADSYETAVRRDIDRLGLTETVVLTGYLSDQEVAVRLRAADIAVLPFNRGVTLKSGTLITLLSFGLPVIATSGGDLPGLAHGQNIWLVPPRDPSALAAAILHLGRDSGLRSRLGAAAAILGAAFSWETIARQHGHLYRTLGRAIVSS
jgi:glycosyltransferase involved in cell wall biosynthesis